MSLTRAAVLCPLALILACGGETPFAPGDDRGTSAFDSGAADPTRDAAVPRPDGGPQHPDATGGTDTGGSVIDLLHADSDCDGLSDGYELSTIYAGGGRTSATNADSDGDGIPDGVEAGATQAVSGAGCTSSPIDSDPSSRTNPTVADSDNDGIADGVEDKDKNGRKDAGETDPRQRDSDGDGLADGLEDTNQNGSKEAGETDPLNRDSDNDGIGDGVEDANHNGAVDPAETNPLANDSDNDGLLDGDEDTNHDGARQPWEADPRSPDTDCDGISDGEELQGSTSPLAEDSDHDGLSDGLESGRTAAVAGSSCPGFTGDADPTQTTDPLSRDSDADGLTDGQEDANHNGRVDTGESNPKAADTDGDGIPDLDEVLAGSNPADPNSPNPTQAEGLRAVCSNGSLQPINFEQGSPGQWTVAATPGFQYFGVHSASTQVSAATLDDVAQGIAAFVLEMPIDAAAPATGAGQTSVVGTRLGAGAASHGITVSQRLSGRAVSSHDGFEGTVSAIFDLGVTSGSLRAAVARNRLLSLASNLPETNFTPLRTGTGTASAQLTAMLEVLVRPSEGRVLVVGAILDRAIFDDSADPRAIQLYDLTNGTALAQRNARRGKGCEPFQAADSSVADFVWMADISASTDDDRGRIVQAAEQVFDALANNNIDFRMGVVPHSQSSIHRPADPGHMRGTGFTRDRASFISYLEDKSNTDGCEFGIDAVSRAITRALPRTPSGQEDPGRVRSNAVLAVVYISDENAQEVEEGPCFNLPQRLGCPTHIGDGQTPNGTLASCTVVPSAPDQACVDRILDPYIDQLRGEGAIAFGQIFNPTPAEACNSGHFVCPNSAQDRNEPGRGYAEVINATGGIFYSPCEANPGQGSLQAIVDAVTGAASEFRLRGAPISASLKVGITRTGPGGPTTTIVPRHRRNGFDFDPVSNAVFFRGTTYRPETGDRVTISYRVWQPPEVPCGAACPPGQTCDTVLSACTCDVSECAQRCGPEGVCGADCNCACAPDCGGRCGPGQVCNQTSCACECAPDCGGCPAGTACDPNTCSCTCGNDCGGACGASGVCDSANCACSCPPSCDSQCGGNARCDPATGCACACPTDCGGCQDGTVCDPASCTCGCPAGCNQACQNRQVCDPNNSCSCLCPADCGGCESNETCDPLACRCVPVV